MSDYDYEGLMDYCRGLECENPYDEEPVYLWADYDDADWAD